MQGSFFLFITVCVFLNFTSYLILNSYGTHVWRYFLFHLMIYFPKWSFSFFTYIVAALYLDVRIMVYEEKGWIYYYPFLFVSVLTRWFLLFGKRNKKRLQYKSFTACYVVLRSRISAGCRIFPHCGWDHTRVLFSGFFSVGKDEKSYTVPDNWEQTYTTCFCLRMPLIEFDFLFLRDLNTKARWSLF